MRPAPLSRRSLVTALLTAPSLARTAAAQADPQTVNFLGWSSSASIHGALRAQITSFMAATGLRVAHQHFPWGSYRTALLSRMLSEGPADVVWLSDAWLPEFAAAGWVRPVDDIAALTRFTPETREACLRGMSYRGEQYGVPYYTDNMAFLYNDQHAFAILPTYRLRALNDPARYALAGHFRVALMPNGGEATEHETCGWVRMYALTSGAAGNLRRLRNAAAFMAAFGGRDHTGEYAMAKRLLFDVGLPFCPTPLYRDPQVIEYVTRWTLGDNMVLRRQLDSVRTKDTISPWFGNWQALTNPLWQAICQGTLSPEVGLGLAASAWNRLKRAEN
jgi:hypothetical protein